MIDFGLVKISFYIFLFNKLFDILTFFLTISAIYLLRSKIKKYIKEAVKEAIKELEDS